jgi:hypothetical protein
MLEPMIIARITQSYKSRNAPAAIWPLHGSWPSSSMIRKRCGIRLKWSRPGRPILIGSRLRQCRRQHGGDGVPVRDAHTHRVGEEKLNETPDAVVFLFPAC